MSEHIERLDQLFSQAFPTNHPAMHDYALLRMDMKRQNADLAALREENARLQTHAKFLANQVGIIRAELDKEQRRKSAWGKEQIDAERDTNARLTDQLEKADAENARLRDVLYETVDQLSLAMAYMSDYLAEKEGMPETVKTARAALSTPAAERESDAAPKEPKWYDGETMPEAVVRLIKAMRSQQSLGYFTNDYWQDLLLNAEQAAAPKEPK